MNKLNILEFLQSNQDERGIAHWQKHVDKSGGLKSFGIGLTRLRKFAKTIGRDADLADELWHTDIYEMKILSLLIDDPKMITIEQAERQVEQLNGGYLAHVFSSCDAKLAKTPFVVELADKWIESDDHQRVRCGYGLLYEISKDKRKSAPSEGYFLTHVEKIDKRYSNQSVNVLMAMAAALMGMGKRTATLNAAALMVANKIGPIDFDPDGRCDPMDVSKHLNAEYVQKKLGLV
ncbi:DNA alkylation repair protein [Maritalea mediterranea]|uniref:DNA alkylation repair protein n=1 Tax=Maritalea mediterranea TaxID=2909667 RepID=A0ABS9E6D9_9HYPH|nr:DNA alkylation repair protein [Maritalea mediterranea]MCF4098353.1 DNA alkylation repair protein [Maritalea mediterranea]